MSAESSPAASPESPAVSNGTTVAGANRKTPIIRVAERRRPVVLPLAQSDQPGSVDLTAEQIAWILEGQDAPP